MATGIPAEGTTFAHGDAASPEVFTTVGRLYDISGVGKATPQIDTTAFSDAVRTYITGQANMSEITLGVRYDPTDTGQDAVILDQTNRAGANYQIVFQSSPTETLTFAAVVTSFVRNGSLDGAVLATVSFQPTSDFTVT